MRKTTLEVQIGGVSVDFPLEAFDIDVKSDFVNDNVQPSLSIDDLTIFGKGVDIVNTHIANGLYYKGLPIRIGVLNSVNVFDGYINLPKKHIKNNDGTINVGIVKKSSLNSLNDRLASITWSMLDAKGIVKQSNYTNLNYVVEKSNNALDIIIMTITLYVMVRELISIVDRLTDTINKATTSVIPAVGVGAVSMVGQIIYATLSIVLQILYMAIVLIAIIDMGKKLFELLLPPVRTHKTMQFREGMEILSNHLGYTFESPITELDTYYYLPSNTKIDEIDLKVGKISTPKGTAFGHPDTNDFGFTGLEYVTIMLDEFNAKLVIDGNKLVMRSKNDPFWKKQSTYKMPDIEVESFANNAKDLVFSKLLRFETDPIMDEYTLSNFKGTNYQILVEDPNIQQGKDDNFIKKHETLDFRLALGNRKNELNAVERTLKTLGGIIDGVTGVFGGGTSFKQKVKNRVGVLKVGENNFTKAKVVIVEGGGIPTDQRDRLSAKFLYEKYINYDSFVLNNFGGQKDLFDLDNVPFGINEFLKTSNNSFFKTFDGADAKFLETEWNILSDSSKVIFEKKRIFAPNLIETYVETS